MQFPNFLKKYLKYLLQFTVEFDIIGVSLDFRNLSGKSVVSAMLSAVLKGENCRHLEEENQSSKECSGKPVHIQ